MYLIIDVETTNGPNRNESNRRVNDRSNGFIFEGSVSEKTNDDTWIKNIYFIIGTVIVLLMILFLIVKAIGACKKYYNKEQNKQSNSLLTQTSVIRRNSSVRNSLVPIRRSSLDVRVQMEIREKRLSQIYMTPLTIKEI